MEPASCSNCKFEFACWWYQEISDGLQKINVRLLDMSKQYNANEFGKQVRQMTANHCDLYTLRPQEKAENEKS